MRCSTLGVNSVGARAGAVGTVEKCQCLTQ
jgi:hypothetical protein